MKDKILVSVFQICSTDSFTHNSQKILDLLKGAPEGSLCLFPENSVYISVDSKLPVPKISLGDAFFQDLKKLCKEKQLKVSLGSVPLYSSEGKLFNTMVFCHPNGELSADYQKIHLFKAQIGPVDIDEGRSYVAGKRPVLESYQDWKVGCAICFDLRFAELFSYYAKNKADLILLPSAFLKKTGKLHWEVLIRARAIETQSYLVAPAQVGTHKSTRGPKTRKSYGHSLVVDPWGKVLLDMEDKEDTFESLELSASILKEARASIIMERKL